VSFQGAKSGYLGLTYPARHHVDVFVRSCSAESSTLLRHVISHEMGHAYDAAHMTTALRAQYKAMRGIPASTPWFGCSYCTDFKTPAGDFAETYSQWQRSSHDSRTQMAPMPGPAQLAAVAAAFFQG
jgi:D-hexose-6-phosphate mutarotase